jgi:hypothetical protein
MAGRLGHDYSLGRPGLAPVIVARGADSGVRGAAGSTGSILEVAAAVSDEEFLSQIEFAIDGPAGAALQPLDDLTPRAWEIR